MRNGYGIASYFHLSEAVQADAVLLARAGIKNPNRPIGSFLFLGPTGVGETEMARTLSWMIIVGDASDGQSAPVSVQEEKLGLAVG